MTENVKKSGFLEALEQVHALLEARIKRRRDIRCAVATEGEQYVQDVIINELAGARAEVETAIRSFKAKGGIR